MPSATQVMNQSAIAAALELYEKVEEVVRLEFKSVGNFFRTVANEFLSHVDAAKRMQMVRNAIRWYHQGSERWKDFSEFVVKFFSLRASPKSRIPDHRKKHLSRRGLGRKVCRHT